MRVPVVPFLTPPAESLLHTEWAWTTADGEFPLPPDMPHWDYQTSLHLRAGLQIDRRAVLDACHLADTSRLSIIVTARSNHTGVEVVAARVEVPPADTADLGLELDLAGEALGGQLTVDTHLVVLAATPQDDLAPQSGGSILWRHRQRTQLEGIGAQFPTDSSDFSRTHPYAPKAGWDLRIDLEDPEAPFMSAVRLTLNSAHPSVVRLMSGGRDEATAQLLRVLNWDVTRQLVHAGLRCEGLEGLEVDPDAVSLGGVLRNLLGTIWPGDPVETLRHWADDRPSRIETRLQQHCQVLA